jgi:hypothetical protein
MAPPTAAIGSEHHYHLHDGVATPIGERADALG